MKGGFFKALLTTAMPSVGPLANRSPAANGMYAGFQVEPVGGNTGSTGIQLNRCGLKHDRYRYALCARSQCRTTRVIAGRAHGGIPNAAYLNIGRVVHGIEIECDGIRAHVAHLHFKAWQSGCCCL